MRHSIEMTESTKSDAKMAGLLREELEALQRQRDQYALAMDTATDPKVAIRLQRTLERIEDEIEGLEESLQALPEPDPSAPKPATPPPPSLGPVEPTDWDDEPSTSIYDPEEIREQLASLETNPSEPIDFASMEPVRAKAEPEDADTTQPRPVVPPEPEPEPEPTEDNPLGPVWMDGLSPPTGQIPRPEAEAEPEPVSPDVLGDDPFAMPGRPPAVDTDASSPFGTAAGSASVDFGNPISVLDDDLENNNWGTGTKIAMLLAVASFLAGAFYVMSIG